MPMYEVRVKVEGYEYYTVRADNENDAEDLWNANGTLSNSEVYEAMFDGITDVWEN